MGESARKAGAPTLAATPLELLTPRPGEGYSLYEKHGIPVMGTLGGLGSVLCYKRLLKRPLWSGLHIYVITGVVSYYLTSALKDSFLENRAEKDAVFKHYISLHPEDFPPYERKRFKDIFVKWYPIR